MKVDYSYGVPGSRLETFRKLQTHYGIRERVQDWLVEQVMRILSWLPRRKPRRKR